jgi:hypothetical protein
MFQNGTTEVREEAILAKNIVIGPRLAPGLRQSGREKNKEPKLSISIILRARMKFLRTTAGRSRLSKNDARTRNPTSCL